jgi:hypothetical protein
VFARIQVPLVQSVLPVVSALAQRPEHAAVGGKACRRRPLAALVERAQVLARGVEQQQGGAPAGRGHGLAVGREGQRAVVAHLAFQPADFLPRSQVPDLDRPEVRRREEKAAVGREGQVLRRLALGAPQPPQDNSIFKIL